MAHYWSLYTQTHLQESVNLTRSLGHLNLWKIICSWPRSAWAFLTGVSFQTRLECSRGVSVCGSLGVCLLSAWLHSVLTHICAMCGCTVHSLRMHLLNIQNMWKWVREPKVDGVVTWLLWPGCVWHPSFWNKQHLLRQTNAWKKNTRGRFLYIKIFVHNRHNCDIKT